MSVICDERHLRRELLTLAGNTPNLQEFLNSPAHIRAYTARNWDIFRLCGMALRCQEGLDTALAVIYRRVCDVFSRLTADPVHLLKVMQDTHTIASDHCVLPILFPTEAANDVPMVFHCAFHQFETFCVYLIDKLHATTVSSVDEDDTDWQDSGYPGYIESRTLRIGNVIVFVTRGASFLAADAIPWKPSTHLMNCLSANRLTVPYPWLTKAHRGKLHVDDADVISKWDRLGWALHPYITATAEERMTCMPHKHCSRQIRFLDDDAALCFVFGDNAHAEWDFLTVAWILGGPPCGNDVCALECVRRVELIKVSL